jgi:hypothetical protein
MAIHPVNCLKKLYSVTTARPFLYSTMAYSFIFGVALNGFEFLENLGTQATGMQLSSVAVTCENRQALEIAYNLGESLSSWIFSLDYVFIAVGFAISTFLSFRYPLFTTWHGVVGAICTILSLAAFALDVAQVATSSVYTAYGTVSLLLMGVFFPLWLVWLGYYLGSDEFKLETDRGNGSNSNNNNNNDNGGGNVDIPPTL